MKGEAKLRNFVEDSGMTGKMVYADEEVCVWLKHIRELRDKADIEDAWVAHHELGENIPWGKLRKEL